MPSEPMNIQEQGFRSSLFGFDKNDVLAYMNALANEAQQHELEYNRQLQQLQSKLDELRSERGTADSRMEALKAELAAATQRADTAEAKRREADEQLETIKKKTASFQSTQRESQKNANIWQLKCHDLQQQVDELQKQLTAARALNTAAAPAAPTSDLVRERLARVDERLSAATLDLDGLTQAIYQALDQTEAELKDLGTDMRSFAQGTPETDIPAPVPPRPAAAAKPAAPSPEKPAERLRVKAKAQPVHHTAPAAPVHRLRNTRRPISQLLQDQIDKLGQEEQ